LKRHQSHQGGRDVDLGSFFRNGAAPHFVAGTASNLDLPRNWTLVRALVTCTDVETILLDTRVQRLLYKYAASIGEDQAWLDRVFHFAKGSKSAIVKHVAGHRNHYHVRFITRWPRSWAPRPPDAVELKLVEPPVYTVRHVVRPGQTMDSWPPPWDVGRAIGRRTACRVLSSRGPAYRIPVKPLRCRACRSWCRSACFRPRRLRSWPGSG
jgi:hypothetical protein